MRGDLSEPDPQIDAWFEALIRLLASARGPDRAVTLDALTAAIGTPSRRLTEQLIQQRLQSFPFVLVAGARGYHIPTAAEQINRYVHSLHTRHREMQLREQTVIRKAKAAGYPFDGGAFVDPPLGQPELFA